MAEEMQGIMGLPEAPPQEAGGQIDPSKFSPVIESYAKNSPREFNKDILGGIAEVDPALADQFIRELANMDLPPDAIDALQLMVDNILAAPQDYAEDRMGLLAEGVPEDLLPEQFDPAFFAALNVALDQLELHRAPEPAVPAYADGGIINAKAISQELAKMGRGGDTMLAHINPQEARMLRERGGSGTINPNTGLREYGFFKKAFKKIGKAVKGVAKGIGKVVKGIANSTIGRIVLTMAAVYFMGPAGFNLAGGMGLTGAVATGVNTFAASTLVNLASGQKLGQALKGGIVSGALAGVTTGAMKAFGPATPAPVTEGSFTPTTPAPGAPDLSTLAPPPPAPVPDVAGGIQNIPVENVYNNAAPDFTPSPMPAAQAPMPAAPAVNAPAPTSFTTPAPIDNAYMDQLAKNAATPPATPGVMDLIKDGKYGDAASAAWKNISPSEIQKSGVGDAIKTVQQQFPNATEDMIIKAAPGSVLSDAYKAALPGLLSTYGPMAAVGLGAAYLGGAFKPVPAEDPANMDMFKTSGADLLAQQPDKYGLSFGGTRTSYGPNPYANMYSAYKTVPAPVGPVATMAKGGIASLEDFPRKTGPIAGPGTGTSDSVPAMLSDGEFVFTAKAVRAMGQGSRRKGAKRMYALMKQLEKRGK
mgnify:CR=1 FL=1